MDTRQTPAERAAAERAVKDEAAQASAMRQAAAIKARDSGTSTATADAVATRKAAAVESAKRRPALVGPLTARLAVENAALEIEEKAALALEEAEAEVGNDELWFILTQVFKPDSLSRLLAQCRAQVVKFDAAAEAEKAVEKAKPAVKAEKPAAGAVAVAEPEVEVDEAAGTLNRFLAEAIVQATKSDNRP